MPRTHPGILVLAGAIAAAVLVFLYVIPASSVHDGPPAALAALRLAPVPKPLPAAAFVDARGENEALSALRGRPVILNLWATWCAPCVRELPALGHLAATIGDDKLAIVTVNAGHETAAQTAAFLKAHGAGNLPADRDPELALLTAFGAQGLPFSVVIDAKGKEIARASGPMGWDDPAAIAYFKALASAR